MPMTRNATDIKKCDRIPTGPKVVRNPGTVKSPAKRRAIENARPYFSRKIVGQTVEKSVVNVSARRCAARWPVSSP